MQITRTSAWNIAVKLKNTEVSIGDGIKIGDVPINGPGEYDVAGVSVLGLQVKDQTVYALHIEDMRMCVVPRHPVVLNSSELEQIGSVDIVVAPFIADHPTSETMAMVNLLEPQMVIVTGDGDVSALVKADASTNESSIKVTKATLPLDSRDIIVLTPTR